MLLIGGLVFLLACVFGSYVVSGGSVGVLVEAIPFEMVTIGGSAIAAFIMANSMHDVKHTVGGMGKLLKGAVFKKADYVELLSLMFFFTRLASTKGAMALESHIEKPAESPAFQKFPKILGNHHASSDDLRLPADGRHERRRPAPDRGRDGARTEEDAARGTARRPLACRPWPTRCRRSASSPRCSA